jgi:hypothetical protein
VQRLRPGASPRTFPAAAQTQASASGRDGSLA